MAKWHSLSGIIVNKGYKYGEFDYVSSLLLIFSLNQTEPILKIQVIVDLKFQDGKSTLFWLMGIAMLMNILKQLRMNLV